MARRLEAITTERAILDAPIDPRSKCLLLGLLQLQRAAAAPPRRRQHVPGCPTCDRYPPTGFFPPHDASPRCESGGRDHCTCDTCF